MKYFPALEYVHFRASPPSRGAWIEIVDFGVDDVRHWSPPSRGAWIEMAIPELVLSLPKSPPSRGAWIEM